MRPFYYPLLVILALAGLTIVAANLRSYEQSEVCTLCGRTRDTVRVSVFGTPFDHRIEEGATAFTSAWPGALLCTDHAWLQTDNYVWTSMYGGYRRATMTEAIRRLLDAPDPALLLQRIDPARAERLLRSLIQEGSNQGGYYVSGNRVILRQQGPEGPTTELLERLREKPMTADELREWDLKNSEPPETPSRGD